MARPIAPTGLYSKVRPTSVIDEVQQQVLKLITEGRLLVNDRLPAERGLAEMLGVSRPALREALRGLTEKGVLEARQGAGWFVYPKSDAVVHNLVLHFRLEDISLEQLAEARVALEPKIAAMAANRRTEKELDALERCVESMSAGKNAHSFLHADTSFHEILARASHNLFFALAIKPIMTVLEETREGILKQPGARERIIEEHRGLSEAVRSRDSGAAERAMLGHLDSFIKAGQRMPRSSRRRGGQDALAQTRGK